MIVYKRISRLSSLFMALLYAMAYDYVYRNYMFPVFGYMGVDYEAMTVWSNVTYTLLVALPVLFYKGFKNIATLFSFVTYMFIYIPFIHGCFTVSGISEYTCIPLCCVLFIGMCIFFATDDVYYLKDFTLKIRKGISFKAFEIIAVLWLLLILVLNSRSITFVNIFDKPTAIYELRAANSGMSSSFENYLFSLFEKAILPVLLLVYLSNKQRVKTVIVICVFILCFAMDFQKITFFMPFLCVGLYYWMKRSAYKVYRSFHILIFAIMIILPIYLVNNLNSPLNYTLASFLIMRTQCVGGWLTDLYLHFFENNPYTVYTHINFIGKLTMAYPYDEPLGRAVAYGSFNANANFWLTDGYAALGIVGVIIMILCFVVFKGVMNSISLRYKKIVVVAMLFAISGFLNVSLFTALITGGFALIYLIFLFVKIPSLEKSK